MTEIKSILFYVLVMCATATLILLAYSYRSNGRDFKIGCWCRTNVNRFAVGGIMIFCLAVVVVLNEDLSALLPQLSFFADRSPVGLGVAVATYLIAGMSGNPAQKGATSETETNSN